jgi:hypothetical protein
MSIGKEMLGRRHVMPSVVASLAELQIEGTFPSGTYLVTVHHPISSDSGNLEKALYGSFLPIPSNDIFALPEPEVYEAEKQPGAIVVVKNQKITLNEGRKRIQLKVVSKGDRPIQVCRKSCGTGKGTTKFHRLDHITTSSRRIHNSSSIVVVHMASALTSLQVHPYALSLVTPRPLPSYKLLEIRSLLAVTV